MMCDVPPGSLGVQPVDGAFPTGAPMALLSPTNYLTFGGTGSGMRLYSCLCPGLIQSLVSLFLIVRDHLTSLQHKLCRPSTRKYCCCCCY